jgi:serpin B
VQVPTMRLTGDEARFPYAEAEGLQVLELPYEGEQLSMLLLLPRGDSVAPAEAAITSGRIGELRSQLNEQRVDVYLPKFTFKKEYKKEDGLNAPLTALGMPSAFKPGTADFSGMDGSRDLFIGWVIHEAFIDVNEEGTEAAAATGVGMRATSMPMNIPEFRADHPFVFVIQEKQSGLILFVGRVENPVL